MNPQGPKESKGPPWHPFLVTQEETAVLEVALEDYVRAWKGRRVESGLLVPVAEQLLKRLRRIRSVHSHSPTT